MIRSSIYPAGSLVVVMSIALFGLTPVVAPADGPRDLKADDVRAAFAAAGLATSAPGAWTDGGVLLFGVDDAAVGLTGQPQLRVFVYPSAKAAASAYQQAHAQDEARRNRTISFSDQRGPQLLTGYGASAWHRNVALVQASDLSDSGSFPTEPDCVSDVIVNASSPLGLASRDFELPTTRVDPRFLDVLARLP
jgi:hypothetical protein